MPSDFIDYTKVVRCFLPLFSPSKRLKISICWQDRWQEIKNHLRNIRKWLIFSCPVRSLNLLLKSFNIIVYEKNNFNLTHRFTHLFFDGIWFVL